MKFKHLERRFVRLVVIVLILFSSLASFAQKTITWRKSYVIWGTEAKYILPCDWGYLMTGLHRMNGQKLFVMGLNEYGDSLWFKYYNRYHGVKAFGLSNGNFMIVTSIGDLIKCNSVGDTIGSMLNQRNMRCTNAYYWDNRFYICGDNGALNFSPVLMITDSVGVEISYHEYLFNGIARDFLKKNNSLYITGDVTYPDIFLLKTDSLGEFEWVHKYNLNMIAATSMLEFSDKLIVGGIGKPFFADGASATLTKFDLSGNLEWHKTYDPGSPYFGFISYVSNSLKGNVITMGTGNPINDPNINEARLISYDYDGKELWRKQYGLEDEHFEGRTFAQTKDSGYIFSGPSAIPGNAGNRGITFPHVIKTDKFGNVKTTSIQSNEANVPDGITLFQNYPNPFNPSTVISYSISNSAFVTLKVFDMLGREVMTLVNNELKAPGNYEINVDGTNLSNGVYFYRIEIHSDKLHSGDQIQTKRMVLIK